MSGTHRHDWSTRSQHATSEGTVAYQHCRCGSWRIAVVAAPCEVAVVDGRRVGGPSPVVS